MSIFKNWLPKSGLRTELLRFDVHWFWNWTHINPQWHRCKRVSALTTSATEAMTAARPLRNGPHEEPFGYTTSLSVTAPSLAEVTVAAYLASTPLV